VQRLLDALERDRDERRKISNNGDAVSDAGVRRL